MHEVGAYRKWAEIYASEHGVSLRTALDPTSTYSLAFAEAMDDNFSDITPDGPFAHLLNIIGLRDEQADWNVGETQAT